MRNRYPLFPAKTTVIQRQKTGAPRASLPLAVCALWEGEVRGVRASEGMQVPLRGASEDRASEGTTAPIRGSCGGRIYRIPTFTQALPR